MFTRRAFIQCLFGTIVLSGGGYYILEMVKSKKQIAEITLYPSPLLQKISKPVNFIDEETKSIIKKIRNTLQYRTTVDLFLKSTTHNGLSAPQIGYLKRIIVCGIHGRLEVLINPEIISQKGTYLSRENCLSLPGYDSRIVKRSGAITIQYMKIDGSERTLSVKGRYAAFIEHEIDHLNGKLYIDHPTVG